jgi:Fic family protein
MNSYYSNLIEGHRTRPKDIDAAIRKDFSKDPAQRALQMLHTAHVEAQVEMEARLPAMSPDEICSEEFLCWLHRVFYSRMPDVLREVKDERGNVHEIHPGQMRQVEVAVGRHTAPASRKLIEFLKRFKTFYGPRVTDLPDSLIAAAAAHHRLAWIHPFLDGNGRVARLFTQAWFIKAGIDSEGIWTLSRGLARRKADYQAALANADERRLNDYDGRGYLSERYLGAFCRFFLDTAVDQVEFMRDLLGLDGLVNRIVGYGERREFAREIPSGSAVVLREIFLRGEIPRGDVSRVMGASPRTAQKLIGGLLSERLITSPSAKGPLRFGLPASAAASYFPELFPAGAD